MKTASLQVKKGLVFVAHGSRNSISNQHIACLANAVKANIQEKYTYLNYGFLESAEPSISDAINQQIQIGMYEIVIFPYFLSNGNHVSQDIPAIIHVFQKKHPSIIFTILPVFGNYLGMASLISGMI
jgi:sirohydrochlorin ferrochelatase